MPAKTPQDIIDQALALYRSGKSSTEISKLIDIEASVASNWIRRAGLTRTISEAKQLFHKNNPAPLKPIDKTTIHRQDDSLEKTCATCKQSFPATLEFFYKRTRANGYVYLSSSCKKCCKNWAAKFREQNPDKVKASMKKTRERHGHLHEKQKMLRRLFDPAVAQQRKETNQAWQANNKESLTIYRQAYYSENKETIKERDTRWRLSNPVMVRTSRANRKARVRLAEGGFTSADIKQKTEEQNGLCFWCGTVLQEYHIDHLVPIAKGGTNYPDNLVISCPTCNVSRGAKPEEEFREYLAFIKNNQDKIEERRAYMRDAMRRHREKKRLQAINFVAPGR